jgi:hypothetical protein
MLMHPPRNISNRQYPRIPLDNPAQLEVLSHLRKACDWPTAPVTIRTASCEGVGLILHQATPKLLLRRDKIRLSFRINDDHMDLPGHVVWSNQGKGGELDLGIRLDLAFARANDRRAYSSWVVSQIVSLRDQLARSGMP